MTEKLKPEDQLNSILNLISYLTENTGRLHYKHQPVNLAWGKKYRCLLRESYNAHIYTLWAELAVFYVEGGTYGYHSRPVLTSERRFPK
jgi:TorA maturation chaperone TorD